MSLHKSSPNLYNYRRIILSTTVSFVFFQFLILIFLFMLKRGTLNWLTITVNISYGIVSRGNFVNVCTIVYRAHRYYSVVHLTSKWCFDSDVHIATIVAFCARRSNTVKAFIVAPEQWKITLFYCAVFAVTLYTWKPLRRRGAACHKPTRHL